MANKNVNATELTNNYLRKLGIEVPENEEKRKTREYLKNLEEQKKAEEEARKRAAEARKSLDELAKASPEDAKKIVSNVLGQREPLGEVPINITGRVTGLSDVVARNNAAPVQSENNIDAPPINRNTAGTTSLFSQSNPVNTNTNLQNALSKAREANPTAVSSIINAAKARQELGAAAQEKQAKERENILAQREAERANRSKNLAGTPSYLQQASNRLYNAQNSADAYVGQSEYVAKAYKTAAERVKEAAQSPDTRSVSDKFNDTAKYIQTKGKLGFERFMASLNDFGTSVAAGIASAYEEVKKIKKDRKAGLGMNTFDIMSRVIGAQLKGYTEAASSPESQLAQNEKAQAELESIYGDKVGEVTKFVGELDSAIAYMAPTMALSYATAGATSSAGTLKLAQNAITSLGLGVPSFQDGVRQAKNEGASDAQAIAFGAASGVINGPGELLIGGIGGLGSGYLDTALSRVGFSLKDLAVNPIGKAVLRYVGKSAGEGLEEAIQGIAETAAKKAIYNPSETIDWKELGKETAIGAVMGGIFNAPNFTYSVSMAADDVKFLKSQHDAISRLSSPREVDALDNVYAKMVENLTDTGSVIQEQYSAGIIPEDTAKAASERITGFVKEINKLRTVLSQKGMDIVAANTDTDTGKAADIAADAIVVDYAENGSVKQAVDYIVNEVREENAAAEKVNADTNVSEDAKRKVIKRSENRKKWLMKVSNEVRNGTFDADAENARLEKEASKIKPINNIITEENAEEKPVNNAEIGQEKPLTNASNSDTVESESNISEVENDTGREVLEGDTSHPRLLQPDVLAVSSENDLAGREPENVQANAERWNVQRKSGEDSADRAGTVRADERLADGKQDAGTGVPGRSGQLPVDQHGGVGEHVYGEGRSAGNAESDIQPGIKGIVPNERVSDDVIAALVNAGSKHWMKDGKDRIYIQKVLYAMTRREYDKKGKYTTYLINEDGTETELSARETKSVESFIKGAYIDTNTGALMVNGADGVYEGKWKEPAMAVVNKALNTQSVEPTAQPADSEKAADVESVETTEAPTDVAEQSAAVAATTTQTEETPTATTSGSSKVIESTPIKSETSEPTQRPQEAKENPRIANESDINDEKKELKKGDERSLNGQKAKDIFDAIESGNLTSDSFVIKTQHPGFTLEQQKQLVAELLDGLSGDAETITVDIKDDGVFTVSNNTVNVSNILSKLGLGNIESTGIPALIKNAEHIIYFEYGGHKYISDRFSVFTATDSIYDAVSKMKNASIYKAPDTLVNGIMANTAADIDDARSMKLPSKKPNDAIIIKSGDDYIAFDARRFRAFVNASKTVKLLVNPARKYGCLISLDAEPFGAAVISLSLEPANSKLFAEGKPYAFPKRIKLASAADQTVSTKDTNKASADKTTVEVPADNTVAEKPTKGAKPSKATAETANATAKTAKATAETPKTNTETPKTSAVSAKATAESELTASDSSEELAAQDVSSVATDEEADSDNYAEQNFTGLDIKAEPAISTMPKGERVKSITELLALTEELFDVPISSGKIPRKKLGVYKTKPEVIRTKVGGDFKVVTHELGHHLDKQYNLSELSAVDELMSKMDTAGLDKQTAKEESVAEYFRALAMDENFARTTFPKFTEQLFFALPADTAANLRTWMEETNAYYSSTVPERYRRSIAYKVDELGIVNKVRGAAENPEMAKKAAAKSVKLGAQKFMRMFVDKYNAIRSAENQAGGNKVYREFRMLSKANNRVASAITMTVRGLDYNTVISDGLSSIIKRTCKSDEAMREFNNYLKLQRAYDLETIKGVRTYADEDLQNAENIKSEIDRIEQMYPDFVNSADEIYDYEYAIMQEYGVKSGLMTQEFLDALWEKDPHYVPFYRLYDKDFEAFAGRKRGATEQRAPIKRIKGSAFDTYAPIENLVLWTARVMGSGIKNHAAVMFTDMIDSADGAGYLAEQIPPDVIGKEFSTESIIGKVNSLRDGDTATQLGADSDVLLDDVCEAIGDSLLVFEKKTYQGNGVIRVMRDGEPVYYQVRDKELYGALTAKNVDDLADGVKVVRNAMNGFKLLNTGISPYFGMFNPIRDFFSGYVSSSTTSNPFKYTKDWFAAFTDIITNDNLGKLMEKVDGKRRAEWYKLYQEVGGGYSGSVLADMNNFRGVMKELTPESKSKAAQTINVVSKAWDVAKRLVDAGDNITRLAEFKRAYKATGDLQEALYASMNVTVDFSRGGTTAQAIDAFVPYFKASINAMAQMYDVLIGDIHKEGNAKRVAANWMKLIGLTAMYAGLFALFTRDEDDREEYAKVSSTQKNRFMLIPRGDGKYVRIPKPQNYGVLGSLAERAIEKARGNKLAFYDIKDYLIGTLLPATDMILFGTMLDLKSNTSWTGAPIVPQYMQDLPPRLQYDDKTTEFSIWLGDAINASPKQIDYFLSENTGFIWRLAKSANALANKDKSTAEKALLGVGSLKDNWIVDNTYSTDIVSAFYDAKEKYDQAAKGYTETEGKDVRYTKADAFLSEKYGAYSKMYSALNNASKELKDEESRDAKRLANDFIATMTESEIDKTVCELVETSGYIGSMSKVLPYLTLNETFSRDKKQYGFTATEQLDYFDRARKILEREYKKIVDSSKSDVDKVKAMIIARENVKDRLDELFKNAKVDATNKAKGSG